MDSKVENTEHGVVLTLYGDVTIQSAVELKGVLARELGNDNNLTVNLACVTGCDLSLFQLLCAAHKKSLNDSRPMSVSDCSPAVLQVISSGGLNRDSGCVAGAEETCFWQKKDTEVTP
ncbi:MAG: STAS domain-containing protein [Syntrophorhabdaceae bacterium]|nr:STAS domain-containing protein [Syntrophorhabdaceae bacterium]